MAKVELFNKEIITHSQSIKVVYYSTNFGEDLNINENPNLEFTCSYDVLTHKENSRDHILILEYNIVEPSQSDTNNEFHIVVEGHYEITENVEEKSIENAKHFGSLPILFSFLRTAVFNVTSLTKSGPHHIPPINLNRLHDNFVGNSKTKKKNKASKK